MTDININQIINDIKSELTEDSDENRRIILNYLNKYSSVEGGEEVIKELGTLIYDYLTPEELENFEKILDDDVPERKLMKEVTEDINSQKIDEAIQKLEEYINNPDKGYVNDDKSEYHQFNNQMEVVLFEKYITPEREVLPIPAEVPLVDIYHIYAYLLIEKEEYDEAIKYLNTALEYNPVSLPLLEEIREIYKILGNLEKLEEYIRLSFKYSYNPTDIARVYRDYGYYYAEKSEPETAVALYLQSLKFDNNELAYRELHYLQSDGQDIELTLDDVKEVLEENSIPLVANSFIIEEYTRCGDRFTEDEEYEKALEMYTIAFVLDDSPENQLKYKTAEKAVKENRKKE